MAEPPPRSRRTAAAHFLLTGQLQTALTLLLGLALTPLLLAWLGRERYGLLRVLESYWAWLAVALGCLTTAGSTLLAPKLAAGDRTGANGLLGAFARGQALLGAVTALAALALLGVLPDLAEAPASLAGEVRWAFAVTAAAVVFAPLTAARILFEADQRGSRVNLALVLFALVLQGLCVAAAAAGFGLPGQAAAAWLALGVQTALLYLWARRDYPWLSLRAAAPDAARPLAATLAGMLLGGVLGIVVARLEPVVVNRVGGPAAVTTYLFTQKLFALGLGQLFAICTAVWAPFSDLYHRGERAAVRRHLRACHQLLAVLGYAGVVPLLAYDRHFVTAWVGADQFGGAAMVAGFAAWVPLAAAHALQTWLLSATGRVRQMLPGIALYCAVSVGGCGLLGRCYGPAGVAWGMALGSAVFTAVNLRILTKNLDLAPALFLGPYLRATCAAAPWAALAWWWGQAQAPLGWIGLLLQLPAACVVLLGWLWLTALSSADRASWRGHAAALLRRRGATS